MVNRKVAIVLEELGLDYHSIYLDNSKGEAKGPEHTKYNPSSAHVLIPSSELFFVLCV